MQALWASHTVRFRARHFPYNATSVPGEYLADNALDNAKKLGCLPVFLYVPLPLRVAAGLVAMRLKLEFLGLRWNFLENIGKDGGQVVFR